jgi:hypothetical protein
MPEPPKGHVWVEWVGEVSPLDNPVVEYKLVTNQLDAETADILRSIAQHRVARVEGFSWRSLHTGNGLGEINHLQEPIIVWGPNGRARPGEIGSYIQAVKFADADKIKSTEVAHQFRIWWERDGLAAMNFSLPSQTILLGKEELFEDLTSFRRAMGWNVNQQRASGEFIR